MEMVIAFLVLLVLAALIVPLLLSITYAGRLRSVESTLKKLNDRIAVLEFRGRETNVQPEKVAPPTPVPEAPPAPVPRAPPPPLPAFVTAPLAANTPEPHLTSAKPAAPVRPAIDWEAFMGVKLFAWLGGFVLFLGVVFLVKYSFENNLVTPRMRVAIGALIGLALIAAGWRAARKNYRVPGQSLCATGVLVLYADIFVAHAFYDLISLTPAFALMSGVTIAAFFFATAVI